MVGTQASGGKAAGVVANWQVYALIGLGSGLLSGLLGIGGTAILVPGMVDLLGLRQHQAHGTSLMIMIPTAALSAMIYAWNANMDWRMVALYSASSMVGAVIGAWLMTYVPPATLRRLFVFFLLFVSLRMILG